MQLSCTTTAGRHAAQLRRDRELSDRIELQDGARREVEKALRLFGLTTLPCFDTESQTDRSLGVDCRLATPRTDREFVYAVLESQGWKPDVARLSRFSGRHDVIRLKHQATGAALVVIIKSPCGEDFQWEAA